MVLKISKVVLAKILKNKGKKNVVTSLTSKEFHKKRKKPQYTIRCEKAVNLLNAYKTDDTIKIINAGTVCIVEINNVNLISMNDSLRLGVRGMMSYKKLWHSRIKKIVSKSVLKEWSFAKENRLLIEFVYEVRTLNFMDYDGRIAAFKAPLDGLVHSGLLVDDTEVYVPLIIAKQRKAKDGIQKLKIIISIENNPDRFLSDVFLGILNSE